VADGRWALQYLKSFTAATTTGFATFGILLSAAWVPVLYAAAMAVDAVAALATGWLYDRHGPRVLIALPVLTAGVAALAFTNTVAIAVLGGPVCSACGIRPQCPTGHAPSPRRPVPYRPRLPASAARPAPRTCAPTAIRDIAISALLGTGSNGMPDGQSAGP
jgi:MFS family permease